MQEVQSGLYGTIIEQWGPPGVMVVLLVVAIYFLFRRWEKTRDEDQSRFENDRAEIRKAHREERDAWRLTDQERHKALADLMAQQQLQNQVTGEALIKLTATMGELRGIVATITGQRYPKQ